MKKITRQKGIEELPSDLATFRKMFGQSVALPPHNEQQFFPARWRKVYCSGPSQGFQIRVSFMHRPKRLLPEKEIATRIDDRPLLELRKELHELLSEVVGRAALGDGDAIRLLESEARGLIDALDTVEEAQPEVVKVVAAKSNAWPVLVSPNPQDIEAAIEHVKRLKVGSIAFTPRREGQRIDARNLWTQLAEDAFSTCDTCSVFVPKLQSCCSDVKPHRQRKKAWRTQLPASIYLVSQTDQIIISDWEKRCVELSHPVTQKNFAQWWKCVHDCVLERWWVFRDDYDKALQKIGCENEEEWKRRGMALDRVKQAFESLTKLQRDKSKPKTITGTKQGQP